MPRVVGRTVMPRRRDVSKTIIYLKIWNTMVVEFDISGAISTAKQHRTHHLILCDDCRLEGGPIECDASHQGAMKRLPPDANGISRFSIYFFGVCLVQCFLLRRRWSPFSFWLKSLRFILVARGNFTPPSM